MDHAAGDAPVAVVVPESRGPGRSARAEFEVTRGRGSTACSILGAARTPVPPCISLRARTPRPQLRPQAPLRSQRVRRPRGRPPHGGPSPARSPAAARGACSRLGTRSPALARRRWRGQPHCRTCWSDAPVEAKRSARSRLEGQRVVVVLRELAELEWERFEYSVSSWCCAMWRDSVRRPMLGVSSDAVKMRLSRARALLRAAIGKEPR